MSEIFILSKEKKRAFNEVPKFTGEERDVMFMINKQTRRTLKNIRSAENKVGFMLQRGYFQVKGRFFNVKNFRAIDKRYVERLLGIRKSTNLEHYSSSTANSHKVTILRQYKWSAYTNRKKAILLQHALLHVDKQKSADKVLFAIFDFCWKSKIEIPSYNQLSEIISQSFIDYENTVLTRLKEDITDAQHDLLEKLITGNNEDSITVVQLKKINQSEATRALNYNAILINICRNYHSSLLPLLDSVALSKEADKHFSSWVYKSTQRQLKKITDINKANLYVSSFIKDQYYLRNDYAVDAIIKIGRQYSNYCNKHEKEVKNQVEPEVLEATGRLINYTKTADEIINVIYSVNKNLTLTKHEACERTIQLIESYLEAKDPSIIPSVAKLNDINNDKQRRRHYYDKLEDCSRRMLLKLSPFIKCLEFDENHSAAGVIKAIHYFNSCDGKIGDDAPVSFLTKKDKNAVFDNEEKIRPSLYKALFILSVADAVKSRKLSLLHSYRYKANNRYLIPDHEWNNNKDNYISAAGLDKFKDVHSVLADLQENLEDTYLRVNTNHINGKNPYLKYTPKLRWDVKTPKTDYDVTKYIPTLLGNSKYVPLTHVLSEIEEYTNFSEHFTHSHIKNSKRKVSTKVINAVLLSLGCNLGHRKVAGSSDISEDQLTSAENGYFSLENIRKSNDSIIKTIQSLPLPTVFNADDNTLHTSSDGKKVVVAVNSLLANYSYKYYGREKGVTINSFVDEKQSFFHVNVLTSSDREAPYMMDGLVNHNESLSSDKHFHSTDTHGYTEAIFTGLHFLDISFAPRIKSVGKQTLYGFSRSSIQKPNRHEIAPTSLIVKKHIIDNWDDILRSMASIKLNYCSASLLFKQLAASVKQSQLYKGLKEFGRILKSKYILEFYDDLTLRQKIQKQLNRVELGQKFQEAIFFGRKGVFHVGTDIEIERAAACSTLIRNAIILWNYFFLSDFIIAASRFEKESIIDSISSGSVIAWHHINMQGEYNFTPSIKPIIQASMKEILALRVK